MKKILLIFGFITLTSVLGLRGYFALVPPPDPTLVDRIAEIVPSELTGWEIRDQNMAESEESSARISEFLNFDDAIFRIFTKGNTHVGLYIAYWSPGKASYRWAGAHTPDTCWVQNGWTRNHREYGIPFTCGGQFFEPAEFGVYEKNDREENVYFWHLVGGRSFGYEQKGGHNIFGALLDIKHHGLNLREEQFFIRLSSNKTIEELKAMDGIDEILASLHQMGLSEKAPE